MSDHNPGGPNQSRATQPYQVNSTRHPTAYVVAAIPGDTCGSLGNFKLAHRTPLDIKYGDYPLPSKRESHSNYGSAIGQARNRRHQQMRREVCVHSRRVTPLQELGRYERAICYANFVYEAIIVTAPRNCWRSSESVEI